MLITDFILSILASVIGNKAIDVASKTQEKSETAENIGATLFPEESALEKCR